MGRRSTHQHVLAAVRERIGLRQRDLAKLVGTSLLTIAKIETGALKLSKDMVRRISEQTGAHPEWLMRNELGTEPIQSSGASLTKESYEKLRRWRDAPPASPAELKRFIKAARGYNVSYAYRPLVGGRMLTNPEWGQKLEEMPAVAIVLDDEMNEVPPPEGFDLEAIAKALRKASERPAALHRTEQMLRRVCATLMAISDRTEWERSFWRLEITLKEFEAMFGVQPAELDAEKLQWLEETMSRWRKEAETLEPKARKKRPHSATKKPAKKTSRK